MVRYILKPDSKLRASFAFLLALFILSFLYQWDLWLSLHLIETFVFLLLSFWLSFLPTHLFQTRFATRQIPFLSPATDGSGLGYFRLIRSTKNLPICLLPGILLTASNLCHTIQTILAHSLPFLLILCSRLLLPLGQNSDFHQDGFSMIEILFHGSVN